MTTRLPYFLGDINGKGRALYTWNLELVEATGDDFFSVSLISELPCSSRVLRSVGILLACLRFC